MSSLLHQFIVRTIREEKDISPHAFETVAPPKVVPHPRSMDIARKLRDHDAETLAEMTGKISRVNQKKLNLNAEESAERDDSSVPKPRKRAGSR